MRPNRPLGLLLSAILPCCATTNSNAPAITAPDAVTLHNHSGYGVFHLYVGAVGAQSWGSDLLGRSPLHDGRSAGLRGVSCGRYDLRLVDEDGDECVLHNQDLCPEPTGAVLNSAELAGCTGWTSSAPPPAPVAPTPTPHAEAAPSPAPAREPVGCGPNEIAYQPPCARPGVDCPTDRPPQCLTRCQADGDCTAPGRRMCVTVALGPAGARCQTVNQACLERPTGECP